MTRALPNLWRHVQLGNVADIIGGGTPSRNKPQYFEGDIAWATPTDVTSLDDLFIEQTSEYITTEALANSSAKLLPKGSVLMTSRATIGFTAITACEMSTNQGFASFVCDDEILHNEYLAYWLRAAKKQLLRIASGTTFKEVSKSNLSRLEIPLPPLSEQQRIAAILRKADGLRRMRREADDRVRELLPALFQRAFGHPNSWKKAVQLRQLVRFVGGGTPSRNRPDYFTGSTPWATSKDIKSRYLQDAEEHITEKAIAASATNLTPAGTILMVVKSKILMHSLPMSITLQPFCFGQDVKGLVCNLGVSPLFIYSAIQAQSASILRKARGVNTEGLTLDVLRAIPIPDVSPSQQANFVKSVRQYDRISPDNTDTEEQFGDLFYSLLSGAFKGELTSGWRDVNADRLHDEAARRDISLKRRSTEPTLGVHWSSRVTQSERFAELLSQNIQPLLDSIRVGVETSNVLEAVRKAATEPLVGLLQQVTPKLNEQVSELLQNTLRGAGADTLETVAKAYAPLADTVQVQLIEAARLPLETFNSAVARQLAQIAADMRPTLELVQSLLSDRRLKFATDPKLAALLNAIEDGPAYFLPEDLVRDGMSVVETEEGLRVLVALGIVRVVMVGDWPGRVRYRQVDPVRERVELNI